MSAYILYTRCKFVAENSFINLINKFSKNSVTLRLTENTCSFNNRKTKNCQTKDATKAESLEVKRSEKKIFNKCCNKKDELPRC